MTGIGIYRWVGNGAAVATVDHSPIRGLITAGTHVVAAYLGLRTGVGIKPAQGALEDCLTFGSVPGRAGTWGGDYGCVKVTSRPIAQMKPHSSRAMAVTTTVGFLPVALSLR
ncbi:hypothetical protein H845_3357 (plasmid) [Komagataeibacter xylinus E25]|nr:hypothetical protein H845_3241 [Komagataeibacter xylinus E25]AHI27232.1 hypothetical protein H845_3331 [Komagataeibacter xylinus E25]AHI27258.1 hypothetical protein H845_3357 [Komagataeibacter xylinus E25]